MSTQSAECERRKFGSPSSAGKRGLLRAYVSDSAASMGFGFGGLPPFLPFSRLAADRFSDLMALSATAAGFFFGVTAFLSTT